MTATDQQRVFQEWLNGYRALLFKIIKAYAFNTEDQNDLFQEVCLQLYRSIPNFRAESAVSTWLYRIALNTAIKWSAQERKHADRHQEIETMTNLLQTGNDQEDGRVAWLYAEIKKMDEIDRSLTLLLLDGCSYKQMAEIMGISEGNIGVKIHRIKKQLITNSKQYDHGV